MKTIPSPYGDDTHWIKVIILFINNATKACPTMKSYKTWSVGRIGVVCWVDVDDVIVSWPHKQTHTHTHTFTWKRRGLSSFLWCGVTHTPTRRYGVIKGVLVDTCNGGRASKITTDSDDSRNSSTAVASSWMFSRMYHSQLQHLDTNYRGLWSLTEWYNVCQNLLRNI